jgi:manganese-transporting P-type ATPase
MAPLVDNPQIAAATLHNPLPLYLHAYVWPFAIVWPIFLRYYLTSDLYEKHIQSSEWTFVWCGTIITAQSLVWLSTNWNVNLKSFFTSTATKTVKDARLIKVVPVANAGSSEICKIVRDNVRNPYRRRPVLLLTVHRLEAKRIFPSFSKSAAFCTIPKRTLLPL